MDLLFFYFSCMIFFHLLWYKHTYFKIVVNEKKISENNNHSDLKFVQTLNVKGSLLKKHCTWHVSW